MKRTVGKILIRADSGPELGTGSVMRCIRLARSLSRLGYDVDFVSSSLPATLARRIKQNHFGLFTIRSSANIVFETNDINELILATAPSWVVLDGQRFDEAYQRRLQLNDSRLLSIEDGDRRVPSSVANLVLEQKLCKEPDDWRTDSVNQEFLSGPEFFLPLADDCGGLPVEKRIKANIRRLLIGLHGSTATKKVCSVLCALSQSVFAKLSVDLVTSNCEINHDVISDNVPGSSFSIRIHRNRDRLPLLAQQADMAIVDADTSYFELANSGVPTLVLADSKKQAVWISELEHCGAVIVAPATELQNALPKLIRSTANNQALRRRLAERGRCIIDGRGGERVARLMAIQGFRSRAVRLDDAHRLHDWRNDPELRAVCFDQELVAFDSHLCWLRNNIESRQIEHVIIEDSNGHAVGDFRLEYDLEFLAARVSVSLIPSLRGRGVGTAFIEHACRKAVSVYPELEIYANIKLNDMISQRSFQKAGFSVVETTAINGHVARRFAYKRPMAAEKLRRLKHASHFQRKAS